MVFVKAMTRSFRLSRPSTGLRESLEVHRVLRSGFLTQGPKVREFEEQLGSFCGSSHVSAMSSATTGLHIALHALGIGKGDEVIVPAFSFPATANVVEQVGATPVMVDILEGTWNINPEGVRDALSSRTKAIMPVHAFGLLANMDELTSIAKLAEVPLIEDAACALGALSSLGYAGAIGDIGVFSFHPRKTITTGEGGAVLTNNPEVHERIQVLRSHGAIRGPLYLEFVDAGFNYRMSDVQAALGVIQMRKLDKLLQSRRKMADWYSKELENIQGVEPPIGFASEHSFQSYVVAILDADRDELIRKLREEKVEVTLGTYGMHLQPYFSSKYGLSEKDFPVSTYAHRRLLTLPMDPRMGKSGVRTVVTKLRKAIEELGG